MESCWQQQSGQTYPYNNQIRQDIHVQESQNGVTDGVGGCRIYGWMHGQGLVDKSGGEEQQHRREVLKNFNVERHVHKNILPCWYKLNDINILRCNCKYMM